MDRPRRPQRAPARLIAATTASNDAAKMLYVHPSDGLPASAHSIEATVRHDYGLILQKARYVHIEPAR